jgi:alkanesulfonate monooxygenase SsuD/methylene tetrahydromethanopterin reductase-like flavin-dependent oxidoreductase (luciferase family)
VGAGLSRPHRWERPGALTCLAVEGRFLQAADADGLRAEAVAAAAAGAAAVFLSRGALGDPIVLAAGLAPLVPDLLLGARISLGRDDRHPAMLARDVTSLDLASGGRGVLCFAPPFTEALAEAVALCRALWQAGEVVSDGPHFPVRAAAARARPAGERSPLIAFDLTGGEALPEAVAGAGDLLLQPAPGAIGACVLERV